MYSAVVGVEDVYYSGEVIVCIDYSYFDLQLKLLKDSFIPPEGWSFDGKWFVNPELRFVH